MLYAPAMTPAEGGFLLRFLLPQLESEHAVTSRILGSIPPDRSGYTPHAKSRTALQLAWHIAVVEIWFLDAVIHRRFGSTEPMPAGLGAGTDVAQWYAESFARRLPLLEALSGDDLTAPVDFIGLRNDPAVAYLNIAIRHSVHHRGQLSAYLRAMGAPVPAIYVESADEPYPPNPESAAAANPQPPPAF